MKAAIITAFDPFTHRSGIERYTLHLADLLRGKKFSVDIFHTGLIDHDLGFYNKMLGKLYALGRNFREIDQNYDFVISNSFYGLGYFPPRIKAFNIYHSSHVTFDKSTENIIPHITSLKWSYLCGYLGEMVSGFNRTKIAVSDAVKEQLERYYSFEGVRVVESGIDVSFFKKRGNRNILRKRYGVPEGAFVGLFVGRWDKTKGSDIVKNLMTRAANIFWLIVLSSGSNECSLENVKNAMVLKEVPYEEMPDIYSLSDFMFFPSRYEGFGLVVIEAMACGLPVMTGEIGVAKKIYGKEPFLRLRLPDFLITEEEFYAKSLEKIYFMKREDGFRRYIAEEGRRIVEEEYTLSRWRERMTKALDLS
ncbi:MAG: glycosyltransferase family 4 protein [Nitrospirota bacterium]